MPSGEESRYQEANKEDQMVERRRFTKHEPEKSQDGDICSSVSQMVTAELQY